MRTALATAGGKANQDVGDDARRDTQGRVLIDIVMRAAHAIWPLKVLHPLAHAAKVSPRSTERWSQGKGSLSAEALADLIRSEQGFKFLEAVMEGHRPLWWRICVPLMEVADVQRMQVVAKRRLRKVVEGALGADRDITAARSRAEALLVQDEDFMRHHLDALGAVGGISNSAVAQAAKGKRR
jgi:hypothetical protein